MVKLLLLACVFTACGYDADLNECTILCSTDTGCPPGLACGGEGLCRLPGATETCAPQFASCDGLSATCGPGGDEDCCASSTVPGGMFFRNHDTVADGTCPGMNYAATLSPFVLDKYEITVGRFRKFVEAQQGTQQRPPLAGSGSHPRLAGSGWAPTWNSALAPDTSALIGALKCNSTWQTWTDSPGANEDLPMSCMTWYEAMTFCIWDGGYLPTYAEWNFAAAGGEEQRGYPWSSPPSSILINCTYANYAPTPSTPCVNAPNGSVNRVGSESPMGDGRWGHSDLAGNVYEFTFDADGSLPVPCADCAALVGQGGRIMMGGSFISEKYSLRTCPGAAPKPTDRSYAIGARCARPVP